MHPDYYATCVNTHQSGQARNIFVDINRPISPRLLAISPRLLALSPSIIFIACRATELNFNPLEVVARARPAVSLQIPLTCPVPGGTVPEIKKIISFLVLKQLERLKAEWLSKMDLG